MHNIETIQQKNHRFGKIRVRRQVQGFVYGGLPSGESAPTALNMVTVKRQESVFIGYRRGYKNQNVGHKQHNRHGSVYDGLRRAVSLRALTGRDSKPPINAQYRNNRK